MSLIYKIKLWVWKNKGFTVITIIFIISFLLMLPLRNFSYWDDFAYIQSAQNFYNTGILKISDWSFATGVFPVYWGVLFTKIFGWSIATLHLSNIVLLYFALISFYYLLKSLRIVESSAVVSTLLLLAFPWIFFFTYTFMTDVIHMSLFIISIYFFSQGLLKSKWYLLGIGSIVAGFCFLTRQTGLVLPIAFLLTLLLESVSLKKIYLKKYLFSLAPFLIILFKYFHWINVVGPTVVQVSMFGSSPYMWPPNLNSIGITNNLWIELLIQKSLGFIQIAIVLLFPALLIYKIKPKAILLTIKRNIKMILTVLLVVMFIYFVNTFYAEKWFTKSTSLTILQYSIVNINWQTVWFTILRFSWPIWIVLTAVTLRNGYTALITDNPVPNKKIYKKAVFVFIFSLVAFFSIAPFKMFPIEFPSKFPFKSNLLLSKIKYLLDPFLILRTLRDSWLFLFVIYSPIVSGVILFTLKKIRKLTREQTVLTVLVLSLLGLWFSIAAFSYYYWDEYIIQYIPFFVIWFAYFFRSAKLSSLRAYIIVIIYLLFSISLTRQHYQTLGAIWKSAFQLVEMGIKPQNIGVGNWAWKPYWFFESSFDRAVEKVGGDKYQLGTKLNYWGDIGYDGNYVYSPNIQDPQYKEEKEVVLKSEPFWLIWGKKSVIFTKVPK